MIRSSSLTLRHDFLVIVAMAFADWHDLEFRQLKYAISVKEHQGFIQAAIALDLDQGFLSRQIQRLEARLGFKLFDRSTRPLGVTEAGGDFLAKAEQILTQAQRAVTLGQATQAGLRGSLTVGINTSIANSHLPEIVQAFCQQFPQVKLTLHLDSAKFSGRGRGEEKRTRLRPGGPSCPRLAEVIINSQTYYGAPPTPRANLGSLAPGL